MWLLRPLRGRRVLAVLLPAQTGRAGKDMDTLGSRDCRAALLRSPGTGLDPHRGRTTTVGDLRLTTYQRCSQPGTMDECQLPDLLLHLRSAGNHPYHHVADAGATTQTRAELVRPDQGRARQQKNPGGRSIMILPYACAVLLWLSMITYATLGGADFGGGIWDLFSLGPEQENKRQLIVRAL